MSEKEFNDWLESIEFIGPDGKIIEPVLVETKDPEDDETDD